MPGWQRVWHEVRWDGKTASFFALEETEEQKARKKLDKFKDQATSPARIPARFCRCCQPAGLPRQSLSITASTSAMVILELESNDRLITPPAPKHFVNDRLGDENRGPFLNGALRLATNNCSRTRLRFSESELA